MLWSKCWVLIIPVCRSSSWTRWLMHSSASSWCCWRAMWKIFAFTGLGCTRQEVCYSWWCSFRHPTLLHMGLRGVPIHWSFRHPWSQWSLSHFWLKENIQSQLWACVGTDFVGFVICLQPGSAGWHPGLLTALLIDIGHSMLNLLVRKCGQQESPHALMLTSILTVAVASCWIPFTDFW